MIFYFTATGNSLYAAKYMEDELVSIPQAIHNENQVYEADRIGIVCPVYGHEVPPMVKDFIRKAEFKTEYFYMVLTYGNRHGGAAELAEKLCEQCGIHPAYINVLLMVDNWLPGFDMNEQVRIDKKVEEQLRAIKSDIDSRRRWISEVTETDRAAHAQFLANQAKLPEDVWQHLIHVGEDCIGCGICIKVCPSGSLHMENGKAVHVPGNCQACLACVHNCPSRVMGLSIPEKNPDARYRNEHINLKEIIDSNQQGRNTHAAFLW